MSPKKILSCTIAVLFSLTVYGSEYKFNFVMHPQGNGLKLSTKGTEEYVLAPLREYKNKFKKADKIENG